MTSYYLDELLGEGEVPSRQLLLDVDVGVESVGELLERLGPLLRALPGDLPQVGHQSEVGALLLGEARHIAEFGDQIDRPGAAFLSLLLQRGNRDDERLPGVADVLPVLLGVVLGQGDLLASLLVELGLGVLVPVDPVNPVGGVVVPRKERIIRPGEEKRNIRSFLPGDDDASQQSLLH